jgi:hypothetical protein
MGFGVFAGEFIPNGTIIETCYFIKLFVVATHPSYDYVFTDVNDNDTSYLPFGYGSIYNHSSHPNCDWRIKSKELNIMEFYSIKDIEEGEEIAHHYGPMYWKSREKKLV